MAAVVGKLRFVSAVINSLQGPPPSAFSVLCRTTGKGLLLTLHFAHLGPWIS